MSPAGEGRTPEGPVRAGRLPGPPRPWLPRPLTVGPQGRPFSTFSVSRGLRWAPAGDDTFQTRGDS